MRTQPEGPPVRPLAVDPEARVRLALAGHREGLGANLGLSVGDDPQAVRRRREALAERLGVRAVAWLHQRHGTALASAAAVVAAPAPVVADAVWTDAPDLACAVLVADCAPVLFWTRDGSRCGAVHAGWRGLAAGILDRIPACAPAAELRAWVGPAIGACCFEVGEEVVDALAARGSAFGETFRRKALDRHVRRDRVRPHVALGAWVRDELLALGLPRVAAWARCTRCAPERFPSHRRGTAEGSREGRMAALVAPAPVRVRRT
jgi:YfiH family protein